MLVGNSYLLVSIVEGINLIFINFYLHRNVWNPGPFPENVEPSLSSAGSLPNDSSESNNSSSIRYVSFINERVEMNKSLDQFSERFYNLHSPNMSLYSRSTESHKRFVTIRNGDGAIDNISTVVRYVHYPSERYSTHGTESISNI